MQIEGNGISLTKNLSIMHLLMKTIKYIIFFSICFVISCTTSLPYSSLTKHNLREILSTYPKQQDHPDTAAIALLSYSKIEMLKDGTQIAQHIKRFKIFNERGYHLAKKSIRYREGYEQVKIFYANTIMSDGTIVSLDEKDIKDYSPYSEDELYTDIKEKKFTMPGIEPNCIVEYAYEVTSVKPTLPYDLFDYVFIQHRIPLKENILEIILPKGRALQMAYFKTDMKPSVRESDGKIHYTFKTLDQPEIISEPDMPEIVDRDVFPQYYCWTLGDWSIVSKWYADLTKQQMQSNAELELFTQELIAGQKTEKDIIRAIFYFVSQKIRYVAVELGPHTHQPHLAHEIFKKRYGDCKDKTTLLLVMLRIAEIEGLPCLVPSVPEAFDKSAPTIHAFDHVIAVVPKKDGAYYWLDATNEVASVDAVPFDAPRDVLLVNMDGSYKFIKTPAPDDAKDYADLQRSVIVKESGDVSTEDINYFYGKVAEDLRYEFKYMSPEKRKQYFEKKGMEVSNLELLNLTELELPFIIKVKGSKKNHVQKLEENVMILSDVVKIPTYDDLTASKTRKYPISFDTFYLTKRKHIYHFPQGYKLRTIPVNFKREDPFNEIQIKYNLAGNVFSIESKSKDFRYKIQPYEYDAFKNNALERQKYKKSVSNIILEKE